MKKALLYLLLSTVVVSQATPALAQEESPPLETIGAEEPTLVAEAGEDKNTLTRVNISFDGTQSSTPPDTTIEEMLWDFGDGTRTTGEKVSHAYSRAGTYTVRLIITNSEQAKAEDTITIHVFNKAIILLADGSATDEQLQLLTQQAAEEEVLLLTLKAKGGGPDVLIEEELVNLLTNAYEETARAHVIMTWTSGSVGANVLSKLSQRVRQSEERSLSDLGINEKGVVIASTTRFGLLAPTAQNTFDQLRPAYVLLTQPEAIQLTFATTTAEQARDAIIGSPIEHQLLGTFSQRTISEINIANFMSFGINYLVNQGIPINNIILILMVPVIATILAFARQVIGIKAFGLITPAMATLSFLVMGLKYGLLVFVVVLLSGTATRIVLRKFHLLYLPRMALVLTNASLAVLLLLGFGVATDPSATLSFTIFPILILTILAEEFIAVQFKSGARTALTITAWTLALSIVCFYIVSWDSLRTLLLSYPEVILLAIPANILLGRFSGLRLTEYFRFRQMFRYGNPAS